jgi:hypothetical protein
MNSLIAFRVLCVLCALPWLTVFIRLKIGIND